MITNLICMYGGPENWKRDSQALFPWKSQTFFKQSRVAAPCTELRATGQNLRIRSTFSQLHTVQAVNVVFSGCQNHLLEMLYEPT